MKQSTNMFPNTSSLARCHISCSPVTVNKKYCNDVSYCMRVLKLQLIRIGANLPNRHFFLGTYLAATIYYSPFVNSTKQFSYLMKSIFFVYFVNYQRIYSFCANCDTTLGLLCAASVYHLSKWSHIEDKTQSY